MKFEKIDKKFWEYDGKQSYCSYDEIQLPKRATRCSAGYDIHSVCDFTMFPGDTITVPTGIKFKCDEDKFLMVAPRSGHGFKYGVMLVNTVGIIDADYYGNSKNDGQMFVKIHYPRHDINVEPYTVKIGDAICQGIIMPYYKVDDDNSDAERVGGFGSTSTGESNNSALPHRFTKEDTEFAVKAAMAELQKMRDADSGNTSGKRILHG